MQVFHGLDGYQAGAPAAVTIGTFDGVHLGHQTILKRLVADAHRIAGEAVVVTFHPHPRHVLRPDDDSLRLLHTLPEKTAALAALGINRMVVLPFTRAFAATPSEVFIREVLYRTLQPHTVVIGYDHRFGAGRGGGIDELREAGNVLGFAVDEIPAQQIDDANVSSTLIRKALMDGDVAKARQLLGVPYPLSGVVVQGKQLGRQLGYPTANIQVDDSKKLVPANGIYAVRVQVAAGEWPGMMSIGTNPTVTDEPSIKLEVNLIGFDGDLYGQPIGIRFVQRLRNEERYESLDVLIAQLARDKADALKMINEQ